MALLAPLGILFTFAAAALGLEIGVYYESRCPASQLFIEKQLTDVAKHADALQLAKVAVNAVPYGNTKERLTERGHYQYECQHGPEECYLNRVEACGLGILGEQQLGVYAPWLACVNKSEIDLANLVKAEAHLVKAVEASQLALKEANRARAAAAAAIDEAKKGDLKPAARDAAAAAMAAANAAHDAAVSSTEMTAAAAAAAAGGRNSWLVCHLDVPHSNVIILEILLCSLSTAGERLQHLMAEQTPPHDYVPWVTLDREHSKIAEKNLRCAICTSTAGKEPSLKNFCAGMEGCDKSYQQQEQQQQQQQLAIGIEVNPFHMAAHEEV